MSPFFIRFNPFNICFFSGTFDENNLLRRPVPRDIWIGKYLKPFENATHSAPIRRLKDNQ